MDAEHLRTLDQLAAAAEDGDPQIRRALPMFGSLFQALLTDPVVRSLEPGSVGHTARLFALRHIAEAGNA
jgi:hypothetical protein